MITGVRDNQLGFILHPSNKYQLAVQADAESALVRLLGAQGQRDTLQRHNAKAQAIADVIEKSLMSSGLEARLPIN